MTLERLDTLVIGAGVVGLAIARRLALSGREVVVAERASDFGTGTSSRNSEVIHAGIYYPPGSLKARLCRAGRDMLVRYTSERPIPYRICGKLIVATSADEEAALSQIAAQASDNDVVLDWVPGSRLPDLEPELQGTAALHSPGSGIIDSHALMLSLLGDLEAVGGQLARNCPVNAITAEEDGFAVEIGGATPMRLRCRYVINAAGLQAPEIARHIGGLAPQFQPTAYFAKGHYFSYAAPPPFSRLIYPIPEPGGLGVHATLDMAGRIRFGPDVDWVEQLDYQFDEDRKAAFISAIRRYFPALEAGRLQPAYTGIRPKLAGPEEGFQDFCIEGPEVHSLYGLVNLFGIESPGLTASLAIAEEVAARLAI